MKKIIVSVVFLLIIISQAVLADEIIDYKGNLISCKIETVQEGFIEYTKDGSRYFFTREKASPIFNDYVDVQENLFKKDSITRFFGKVIVKDMWGVKLVNEEGQISIPWYKAKFIGIYKP